MPDFKSRQHGFSLIELLVSLVVFATLMTTTFKLFNSILDTNEHSERLFEQQNTASMAWSIIFQDMFHLRARPHRDVAGDMQPALESTQQYLVRFVRGGLPAVSGIIPGGLQRVAYQFKDDALYRLSWLVLDIAPDSEPVEQQLFGNLSDAKIEFLDSDNNFLSDWPPLSTDSSVDMRQMPRMIRITLQLQDGREIYRLFPGVGE